MNILFWNIGKSPLHAEITKLIINNDADIIVLAECLMDENFLLAYINKYASSKYKLLKKNDRNMMIIVKTLLSAKNIPFASNKLIPIDITYNSKKYLICGIHLDSKLHKDRDAQENIARTLMKHLKQTETDLGHNNTLLIGDFNMNPFESGMVHPDTFNGISSKNVAGKIFRKVNDSVHEDHMYFYNPMWSYLGDMSPYTPGTYYFNENSHRNHYVWNMYDQVLVRPEIMDCIDDTSINIIDKAEVSVILNKLKHIERITPSDHLPIFVTLIC